MINSQHHYNYLIYFLVDVKIRSYELQLFEFITQGTDLIFKFSFYLNNFLVTLVYGDRIDKKDKLIPCEAWIINMLCSTDDF